MPYKSLAQERYFNVNRSKLEAQGVNVDEYNSASRGMKLPTRAKGTGILSGAKRKPKRKYK